MKLLFCGRVAAFTAALLTVAPTALLAADVSGVQAWAPASSAMAPAAAPRTTDVALSEDGSLVGQALTMQGQPLASRAITISDGRQQAVATTDAKGQFRFTGLRGGAYSVHTGQQTQSCRVWKAGTAPPAATRGLMIVEGSETALGQHCGTPVYCGTPVTDSPFAAGREALRNPVVVGGIVAAAIAIPVALSNSDDDDPAS